MSMTESSNSGDHETTPEELDADAFQTQLAILREENERLREEYARAQQTSYRRTAVALGAVGGVAVALGFLLPDVRDVLFVLGAIGVFGGILTWYLTPERVLTVSVSESIYSAVAANGTQIQRELGLQSTPIYIPTADTVRLFLPQQREFELPDSLTDGFLTDQATRGVALTPSGQALLAEFERAQASPDTSSLQATATYLSDAVVEQFEIADSVSVVENNSENRIVITVEGAAFGSVNNFDHPVVSILACGLAQAHNAPLAVEPIDETTVAFETDVPSISP